MKRYLLLLLIPILACNGLSTPLPTAPSPESATEISLPPTQTLPSVATTVPPTQLPTNATTFPNPDAFTWNVIASGLERPVDLQADGSGRLFVVEKAGRIRLLQNGELMDTPFLSIEEPVNNISNEMGLLGLAFHPDFAQNGFFYVNYTGDGGDTYISRFQASGDVADPNSESILLTIKQPFPNHNGGGLDFGPDGYLYIGVGDGGAAGDPFGNGQSLNTLLGKILRIDVDSAQPYAIPADNPFGNEIWAYGLRNPWRISFDQVTGDLFIGDVGQGDWEEIDILPANSSGGQNFGWDIREGAHDYAGGGSAGLIDPIAEYSHSEGGCSVTGGYVYRGSMPEWNGIYLYGDYCTGYVWGLMRAGTGWDSQFLYRTGAQITSFGQDESGEIYLLSDTGNLYRLIRNP